MEQIVDIATEGLHLSTHRGFLMVELDREEVGRVTLDDVHAVIEGGFGLAVQKSRANATVVRASLSYQRVWRFRNRGPTATRPPGPGRSTTAWRFRNGRPTATTPTLSMNLS